MTSFLFPSDHIHGSQYLPRRKRYLCVTLKAGTASRCPAPICAPQPRLANRSSSRFWSMVSLFSSYFVAFPDRRYRSSQVTRALASLLGTPNNWLPASNYRVISRLLALSCEISTDLRSLTCNLFELSPNTFLGHEIYRFRSASVVVAQGKRLRFTRPVSKNEGMQKSG